MMTRALTICGLVSGLLVCLAVADPAFADWGTIKGRFVVSGSAPELPPLKPTKDQFCISNPPPNETVIVSDDGGLANAVVFIRVGRGKSLEVHPDYAAEMEEKIVLDNKMCRFQPHITLVRTGQPFALKNSDPVGHNTNAKLRANGDFNVIIGSGEERDMTFTKEESLPMPVACNIHTFMKGHLIIRDDPYMAVSGDDGSFEIANIPAGEHEFQFWHEMPGYLKNVEYDGGKLDRRGRADLTIEADSVLDLGDIEVPASLLQ